MAKNSNGSGIKCGEQKLTHPIVTATVEEGLPGSPLLSKANA
jgi:hypothetical protein